MTWLALIASFVAALLTALVGLTLTTGACIALSATLVPIRRRRVQRAQRLGLLAWALAALLWWHLPLHEYADRVDTLSQKTTVGPQAFSRFDLVSVWTLNAGMALAGWSLGFPEAARETFWLAVPESGERHWHSDLAMRSPAVRRAVVRMLETVRDSHVSPTPLPRQKITWDRLDRQESIRAILALNPMLLDGRAERVGKRWRLELRSAVRCAYPKNHFLILFPEVRGRWIGIEEGLFWVAQARGWLHPYTAVWSWTVWSDDTRLRDLSSPVRDWREALWLRIGLVVPERHTESLAPSRLPETARARLCRASSPHG